MIAYTGTLKALDVKSRFSIVHDPKLDDWYIMAGFVSYELNNAQLYSEGDAETANDIIRLTVKETSQGLHPC